MNRTSNLKQQSPYILIVDDDEDDQLFLTSAILETMPGAIVKPLCDGTQAVDLLTKPGALSSALPDLIFLDINMIKLCGQKTTAILKKDEHLKHVPVIILTTSSSEGQKQELLAAGADAFYTKPYNINDLKQIVREVAQKWLPVFSHK